MKKLADNTTTISLKISLTLYKRLQTVSRARGVSMSRLIRNTIEGQFLKPETSQESEIFKYFGIFEKDDEQLKSFRDGLEKRKSGYKSRMVND